ncbi:hypothetical protein K438DRAFT_2000448 [Mycena galopus ATCC 62051]|nr:hypothetical protein K438DRAFT_2000448 [Mycena galopus ATCC 62051]
MVQYYTCASRLLSAAGSILLPTAARLPAAAALKMIPGFVAFTVPPPAPVRNCAPPRPTHAPAPAAAAPILRVVSRPYRIRCTPVRRAAHPQPALGCSALFLLASVVRLHPAAPDLPYFPPMGTSPTTWLPSQPPRCSRLLAVGVPLD